MAGLPKLPGYNFTDPTVTKYHLSQTFNLCNGYKLPKNDYCGIGGRELDKHSVKYLPKYDVVSYDPSLTYGRTKSKALPQFTPHYVLYDQKCLTFNAFFKQGVVESPNEFYRVRHVNIIYFLENDTITVMEPRIPNSGLEQGRLIRRGKIPKDNRGTYWHWKDFNVGKDVAFNGIVFHIVNCDLFTKEYMASQGIVINDSEEMPVDPYMQSRLVTVKATVTKTKSADDKLRRFLEYDGKILRFQAVWDDRETVHGDLNKYEILYFLADDTVSVKEIHAKNDGKDPYPVLLKKIKLPKRYSDLPKTYPAIYLEVSADEITEYYQPKDFQVGETIFVLGRDMLLYDCDKFTRDYFRNALCIEQSPPLDVEIKRPPPAVKQVPPHDGLGSLEDSLQNTITFMPKIPKKDVIRQLINANKYLRYEMVMDAVHPEDSIRRFLLNYSLADGTCKILEPPIKNSGIIGGTYLRSTHLIKPGSDPLNPDFYTPADFYIGAMISVFQQRFKLVGADLYVYRYMEANPGKFPCEVIENVRNYMYKQGYLKDDVEDQVKVNLENERKWEFKSDVLGEKKKTEMEECMEKLKTGGENYDPEYEKAKMKQIREEYERSLQHKSQLQPYGIKEVDKTCPYPVIVGDIKSGDCTEEAEGHYTHYTPKHIDTPEEVRQKYYAGVLKDQREICSGKYPIECADPPSTEPNICAEPQEPTQPSPIMVAKPDIPHGECGTRKTVTFAEDIDRCKVDRNDLCDLKREKIHCDCTKYQRGC